MSGQVVLARPFTNRSHSDTGGSHCGDPRRTDWRQTFKNPQEKSMLLDATRQANTDAAAISGPERAATATPRRDERAQARQEAQRISDMLSQVAEKVALQRRVVHAGDVVVRCGDAFAHLYLLNTGCCKIVNSAADGRAQVVGLQFRGDWLGFDGIAGGHYRCDAVALDTGEVWALRYDQLMAACAAHPPLMAMLHAEMSRVISRERDSLLADRTRITAERAALEAERDEIDRRADSLQRERDAISSDLAARKSELSLAKSEVQRIERELNDNRNDRKELARKVEELTQERDRIDAQRRALERQLANRPSGGGSTNEPSTPQEPTDKPRPTRPSVAPGQTGPTPTWR
jgi:CRP-like cAMP-binding protein